MDSTRIVDWQPSEIEALLIISSAIASLTSPPLFAKIPGFVSTNMNLGSAAFVLVRHGGSGGVELTHVSHSITSQIDSARQNALGLIQSGDVNASRDIATATQISFYRVIDPSNALLLMAFPSEALMPKKSAMLGHIADLLAYLIGSMNSSTTSPALLGAPFDKLTDREWVVLQGLQSVEGEKQLADKLELSPHTLHSHIKSIYRKLGVQGRLPMLVMMENAQRCLKIKYANAAIAKILGF